MKLVGTSYWSFQKEEEWRMQPVLNFVSLRCLTIDDLRTSQCSQNCAVIGAELMSSTLAAKLLWKAAVLDVILINTLYLYVSPQPLHHCTLLSISDLRIKDTVSCLRSGFENSCQSNYIWEARGSWLLKKHPAGWSCTMLRIVPLNSIGSLWVELDCIFLTWRITSGLFISDVKWPAASWHQ